MSAQDSKNRYAIADDVEIYPAGEDVIAIHAANDEIHRLNKTAAQVLDICQGRTETEIAQQLKSDYPGVSANEVEEDVKAVLALLMGKGVLRAED